MYILYIYIVKLKGENKKGKSISKTSFHVSKDNYQKSLLFLFYFTY